MRTPETTLKPHILKLKQLISKGFTSPMEIAMIIEKSERAVYLNLEGKGDFSASEMILVSTELSRHGRNELAELFLSRKYEIVQATEVRTDGQISDEIVNIAESLGHVISNFNGARKEEAMEQVQNLLSQARNLKAECERL